MCLCLIYLHLVGSRDLYWRSLMVQSSLVSAPTTVFVPPRPPLRLFPERMGTVTHDRGQPTAVSEKEQNVMSPLKFQKRSKWIHQHWKFERKAKKSSINISNKVILIEVINIKRISTISTLTIAYTGFLSSSRSSPLSLFSILDLSSLSLSLLLSCSHFLRRQFSLFLFHFLNPHQSR